MNNDPVVPDSDLGRLLGSIGARLNPGVFVFCELAPGEAGKLVSSLLSFCEGETVTVMVTRERAQELALECSFPCAWITLEANSDLATIGFLALITTRLAASGISVNVVSAYRHDHLFVPVEKAGSAMGLLEELQASYGPVPLRPTARSGHTGGVAVRPARLEDAAALAELWEMCGLRFDGSRVGAELEACSRLHGELVLVAVSDERVIGSLWATYDGRRGWLQRIATHPAWRGRGIAAALVSEAESRLVRLGARRANLTIEPENDAVMSFYRALGYEHEELLFMTRRLGERDAGPVD